MKRIKINNKNVFFSSDLHLNHKNICKGTSDWPEAANMRDFNSLEEMNFHIINNINNTVKQNDVLILLGDTLFGEKKYGEFFNKLNCREIYVLAGNHCNINKLIDDETKYKNFKFLGHYQEFVINGQLINCMHYPILSFNYMKDGGWMLYGHVHSKIEQNNSEIAKYYKSLNTLDVGIDNYFYLFKKYYPFNFTEVQNLLKNKNNKSQIDYH